jgi:HAD superfamily hydrolase (TIGR01509 family)
MLLSDIRAVVFDLDGVLVDSEAINIRSAFEGFKALGHALEPGDRAQIVGRHPDDYVPILGERFGLGDADHRRIRELQNNMYVELWKTEATPMDGALDVPPTLREKGYRIGLATSASRLHVDHCFERFPMHGFFDVILTKDDVAQRKPDPEIYLACARELGIEPVDMLVVEDSIHGVQAAKAAGAFCAAVTTPHTDPSAVDGADALIRSLRELPELLAC